MHTYFLNVYRSFTSQTWVVMVMAIVVLVPVVDASAATTVAETLKVTATTPDGTNTGIARLGVPVKLLATVTGKYNIVDWTLSGPGTLLPYGTDNFHATYTPPLTRTSGATATIRAHMRNMSSVKTSYEVSIVNPIPQISANGVAPSHLLTGATQPVTIVGSGFVAGTNAIMNGKALLTDFKDYYHVTVHVPVTNTAKGTLNLQMNNPGPGGGLGWNFHLAVDPNSIALASTGPNGANSSTVALGTALTMVASISGSAQTALNWKVAGAGSISSRGVYSAPGALPSNTQVTITAALASNPAITDTYSLRVVNPVPMITGVSRRSIPSGATTTFYLTGTGFVPGTTITTSTGSVSTKYRSATSMAATVTLSSAATGMFSLTGSNISPGGGTGVEFDEAILKPVSVATAARLLDQTTFGPTTDLIDHVQQEGVTGWLEEQYYTPQTVFPNIPDKFPAYCGDAAFCFESTWWKAALSSNDQLRQRVAYALSELFVISTNTVMGQGINTYANMLARDAFTNWYTIMKDVTLSPGMGRYLDMLQSYEPTGSEIANENFARENMQLFNIGVSQLNQDGTLKLDANGNPQPTYTLAQVQAFARAFTGWTFGASGTAPLGTMNYLSAMQPHENKHDQRAKTLLRGTVLPAGQTAEQDLDGALTNIFNHPNLPPFVCKQLIQHFVTSNPSPAYVSRVVAAFLDDGNQVRGDMKSVLTAIFTDPEARAGDKTPIATGGQLSEPVLWLTQVMRALGYVNIDPNDYYRRLSDYAGTVGEQPYSSPSVFNFFSPNYVIPGTSLHAPEFGIENTGSVTDRMTLADNLVSNSVRSFNVDLSASSPLGKMSSSSTNLVDSLGVLFLHGQMDPNIRTIIVNEVNKTSNIGSANLAQRVRVATYLVITSSQFKVMH